MGGCKLADDLWYEDSNVLSFCFYYIWVHGPFWNAKALNRRGFFFKKKPLSRAVPAGSEFRGLRIVASRLPGLQRRRVWESGTLSLYRVEGIKI